VKPTKTWLITDTHFNHTMLVRDGHRPADFQKRVVANWQRLVKPQDTVWHLGDVILGQNGTLKEILDTLPGVKYLVRGNHDHESNAWYLRHGFAFVAQGVLHGGVWLTHAPQATLPDGAVINVHGHLHVKEVGHRHGEAFPEHCKLLSLEEQNYAPVELAAFVGFSLMVRK
jgi:calcineurin-like phosphoesterase family protein